MVDFSKLKKNNNVERLRKKVDEENSGGFTPDETYWTPTVDKAGNGTAVIRFLPTPPQDGDDGYPYVKYWSHSFKGPGGWYIEKSLTTLGKADPVSELNTKLWNSGVESDKVIARKRKRKLNYVTGIEVISDPANPDSEGKIFKYRFGKKIFDKITDAMNGDEDTEGFDPFDFWNGANFRIKIKRISVDGELMPNYDDSKFLSQSQHHGGDDKILESIWKRQYSLQEIISPNQFKSYDDLKKRLILVTEGGASTGDDSDGNTTAENVVLPEKTEKPKSKKSNAQKDLDELEKEEKDTPPWDEPGDDDDLLKSFQRLAQDDD